MDHLEKNRELKESSSLEKAMDLIISFSTLNYEASFQEIGKGLEKIAQEKLDAEETRFVFPEGMRDYLEKAGLSREELEKIEKKIPFEKEENIYIPFVSNGESNLGLLYLKKAKLVKQLSEVEKEKLYYILSRNFGMILAKTKEMDLLKKQSEYDGLTGLLRKETFFKEWEGIKKEIKKERKVCSVLMIDVDWFKQYNDSYGHSQGDVVLRTIGKIIKNACRPEDKAVRYGGEEFLLFLPNADEEGAQIVAERIRERVDNTLINTSAVRKVSSGKETYPRGPSKVTVSIGCATYPYSSSLDYTNSLNSLISNADVALYEAKGKGRNQVVMFSEKSIPAKSSRS